MERTALGARRTVRHTGTALTLAVAMAMAVSGCGNGTAASGPASGKPSPPATTRASAPKPPAISESISYYAEHGDKTVALTLDDGPSAEWTPDVLDLLKQYGIKATFCMIGPNAKAHPDLVKKIVAAGHQLCDHSVHHNENMAKEPVDYQRSEILDAQKMIEDAAGGTAKVLYYRAPGGDFSPDSEKIAAEHGMRPLGWSVDPRDWSRPGPDKMVKTAKKNLADGGSTIIFHDGGGDRSQTLAALKTLLPWLKQQGYTFGFPQR
ncbi:polysaccharide deacetylase family protein [Streptomyces violascens]|uniref:polysaccharide deacetylase family protein n=1 Tax=Streptomyces violascens TaxID=67381 RepID=UPI0036B440FC